MKPCFTRSLSVGHSSLVSFDFFLSDLPFRSRQWYPSWLAESEVSWSRCSSIFACFSSLDARQDNDKTNHGLCISLVLRLCKFEGKWKGVWQSIIWQLHSLVAFQCLQNSSCRQIHTDTTYVRLFSLHHVHEKSTALTVSTASSILSSSWRCLSSCSFSALQQSSRQWNCTKANLSLLPAILCVKETLDRSCL